MFPAPCRASSQPRTLFPVLLPSRAAVGTLISSSATLHLSSSNGQNLILYEMKEKRCTASLEPRTMSHIALVCGPCLQKALQCNARPRPARSAEAENCTHRGEHSGRCRRHDREKLRLRPAVAEETPPIGSTSALMWNLPLTHIYLVALGGHWALTAGLFSSVHVKQLETGTAPALWL